MKKMEGGAANGEKREGRKEGVGQNLTEKEQKETIKREELRAEGRGA